MSPKEEPFFYNSILIAYSAFSKFLSLYSNPYSTSMIPPWESSIWNALVVRFSTSAVKKQLNKDNNKIIK